MLYTFSQTIYCCLPKVIWEEGRVAALSHTYAVKSPLVTMVRPKFAPQKGDTKTYRATGPYRARQGPQLLRDWSVSSTCVGWGNSNAATESAGVTGSGRQTGDVT